MGSTDSKLNFRKAVIQLTTKTQVGAAERGATLLLTASPKRRKVRLTRWQHGPKQQPASCCTLRFSFFQRPPKRPNETIADSAEYYEDSFGLHMSCFGASTASLNPEG